MNLLEELPDDDSLGGVAGLELLEVDAETGQD